jgi:tetratricopeptide (TPR) repeat protein
MGLWPFWYARGHLSEGRRWLAAALQAAHDPPLPLRAQALNAAGSLAREQGDLDQAEQLLEQSLTLKRQIGVPAGIAASLVNLGTVAMNRMQFDKASAMFNEALGIYTELNDRSSAAVCLGNLANLARDQGRYEEASDLYLRCIEIFEECNDTEQLAAALLNISIATTATGRLEAAEGYCRRAAALFAELGDRGGLAPCLEELGHIAVEQGRDSHAAQLLGAAGSLRREIEMPHKQRERGKYESMLSSIKRSLGEAAFEKSWQAGSALSLEEMVVLVEALS